MEKLYDNKLYKVQNTTIVDNNPKAFLFQKKYGITTKDFIDDENDNCLFFILILVKFAVNQKKKQWNFCQKSKKMLYSVIKMEQSFY